MAQTLSSPLDSCEQPTVQSPSESIFSDDEDVWFEAREQLDGVDTPTSPKAFSPLTSGEEKAGEGMHQHEPKVREGEFNSHSSEQPAVDLNIEGPSSVRDAPHTSVSKELKDNDTSKNTSIGNDSAVVETESCDHVDCAVNDQKVTVAAVGEGNGEPTNDRMGIGLEIEEPPNQSEMRLEPETEPPPRQDRTRIQHDQNPPLLATIDDATATFDIHRDRVAPQRSDLVPATLLGATTVVTCDAITSTDPVDTLSQSTNTFMPEFSTQGVNTDPPPVAKEIGCNTMLNCFDVLQRAREMEELQLLKVEHQIAVGEMNEAKSQKMVAEQLTNIVQSDLAELRQQNLTETTKRLQLENELSDAKVSLLYLPSRSSLNRLSFLCSFFLSLSLSLSLPRLSCLKQLLS